MARYWTLGLLSLLPLLAAHAEGNARLVVETAPPGAQVFLGTSANGITPLTVESLEPGNVAVTLVKEGHKTVTRLVKLSAGETTVLNVDLAAELGGLSVSAPAGGTLFLDGQLLAEMPGEHQEIENVPAGNHRLEWRHEDYREAVEEILVAAGARLPVQFDAQPLPGSLLVVTSPSGAQVRVGDQMLGQTPVSFDLPAGSASLELTHLGYRRTVREVEVFANRDLVVNVDLVAATADDPVCPAKMALLPAGSFEMGIDGYRIVGPQHTVELDAYCIDRYEVTNEEYLRCVEAGACPEVNLPAQFDGARQPVVGVSWYAADMYCDWAGGRLPTEAQWERAARGSQGRTYPWGDDSPSCRHANFGLCGGKHTATVGGRSAGATPEGAHDLAGNVFEWVDDWMDEFYYDRSPARNPTGPESGEYKVLRGGGFSSAAKALAATGRQAYTPDSTLANLGFRCVSTP